MELLNLYWNGLINISVSAILISISWHIKYKIYIKIGDKRSKYIFSSFLRDLYFGIKRVSLA